jgi:hypothetical protein
MAMAVDVAAFSVDDTFEVLQNLTSEELDQLILVGGQAAAFWIARYNIADPRLLTTKDIEVLLSGPQSAVVLDCARDLGGKLQMVSGARAPDVARIQLVMRGAELQIDFLRSLHGITTSEVIASRLSVLDERARGKSLYVMHPAFALASRLFNTFELSGRLNEENLTRLQFSIQALRAYLMENLTAEENPSLDVLPTIERIFELAISRSGLVAWHDHKIDVFVATPNKLDLSMCPQSFLERRYPQMLTNLDRKRNTTRARQRAKSKPD